MTRITLFLYRFLIHPTLWILAFMLSPLSTKLRDGFEMRAKQNHRWPWLMPPGGQRPIWVHCASGEFEYAKPVIRALKAKYPQIPIMVTYFTPSYRKSIHRFKGVDMALPLPYDLPNIWREFLSHHSPRALLIARTDMWPEMLFQTHKMAIPILLFASSLSTHNRRMSPWVRPWVRALLAPVREISCVSELDKKNFELLGTQTPIAVDGDTRFDEVIYRQSLPYEVPTALQVQNPTDIFIAGSTWQEDEAVIVPFIQTCQEQSMNLRFIICPHEPSPLHLRNLCGILSQHGLAWQRLSQAQSHWQENTVLIIDQIGILADLYRLADVAFVGGSFRRRVHSVMEPLACGCWTWFGPKHQTNPEALEFKKLMAEGLPMCITIDSPHEAELHIKRWLKLGQRANFKKTVKEQILTRSGASNRIVSWVEKNI